MLSKPKYLNNINIQFKIGMNLNKKLLNKYKCKPKRLGNDIDHQISEKFVKCETINNNKDNNNLKSEENNKNQNKLDKLDKSEQSDQSERSRNSISGANSKNKNHLRKSKLFREISHKLSSINKRLIAINTKSKKINYDSEIFKSHPNINRNQKIKKELMKISSNNRIKKHNELLLKYNLPQKTIDHSLLHEDRKNRLTSIEKEILSSNIPIKIRIISPKNMK